MICIEGSVNVVIFSTPKGNFKKTQKDMAILQCL